MPDPAIRAVPDPDDFSDLYEKLDDDAPPRRNLGSWRPLDEGPGAEVKGRVVAARDVDGDYGARPVVTIETPDGDITVWGSHSVLRSKLEEHPPEPGSRILIRYDGQQTSSAGREYHKYSVAVDKELRVPQGSNWIDEFNKPSLPSPAPPTGPRGDLPF